MMDEDGQLSEFARQLLLRHHRVAGGGYTLRNIPMPAAPGVTGSSWPTQAGGSYSSGTTEITGKTITSPIIVSSTAVVTITDCKFALTDGSTFVLLYQTGGTVNVSNCYFDGSTFDGSQDFWGILQIGGTLSCISNEFYACANGGRLENGTWQYNYHHSPALAVGAHSDGLEVYNQTGSINIDHNVFDVRDSVGQTSCVNIVPYGTYTVNGPVVNYNSFVGGSYPLYVGAQGTATVDNVHVTNNQWISEWNGDAGSYSGGPYTYGGIYGSVGYDGVTNAKIVEWSGNTLDGSPLSLP